MPQKYSHPMAELLPILTYLWEHNAREKAVIQKLLHVKTQKCFLHLCKGDVVGILTNPTECLRVLLFCSHIFSCGEVIGGVLSSASSLENTAFPVCFCLPKPPICPSVALDSARLLA